MKKLFLFLGSVFLLSGCSSTKDLSNYVEVEFTGMNSEGMAIATVDTDKLNKDLFNYESDSDFLDEKAQKEMEVVYNSYKIKLDKSENLSNGDKVNITVSVNQDKTKKIKSGKKEVVVKGLEEPKKLTSKEVEKALVINFNGTSGRGEAQIDNTFDAPLYNIEFKIKNDGKLKNDEQAKVAITKDLKQSLSIIGYALEEKFDPTFEVKGLDHVAAKVTDISNLDDIKQMIDEEAKRNYEDSEYLFKYDISLNKMMYRQFFKENSKEDTGSYTNADGNLIGIYTIKQYTAGTDSKLEDTFTAIIGFSNIVLDENNKVNVAEMENISTKKDKTYSLDSVTKLYEGFGYSEVK
ncbi:lipoprotein [Vagococcus silagei]|uniref:Uncharacterized protein n=1 Tax=Vagococcus silagei TaxID=2508885 RepID=A0A4S3B4A3_9ENTE|nr:membrane lipoprotein lipid attachment site-containing protein [Vagococcus silagei]THB61642.1 hypothetical protein ESZ54_04105 [Vagococcus silagei]